MPIAAIVLGVLALKSEPVGRGLAIGGIATGAVALSGTILVTLGVLAFLPFLGIMGSFGAFGWS